MESVESEVWRVMDHNFSMTVKQLFHKECVYRGSGLPSIAMQFLNKFVISVSRIFFKVFLSVSI